MEKHVEETIVGGTWIFLGNIVVLLSGFIFWLVIARLAGVESVGIASAIVSSAIIAVTIVSAGMNLAVTREVAAKGLRAFIASLLLASMAGVIAAILSIPLVYGLGYQDLALLASLTAVAYMLSIPVLSSLLGMERFRDYFIATLAGSIMKLVTGVVLALLGFKALAPLLGYLAYPLVTVLVALLALASSLVVQWARPTIGDLKSVAVLTLSNYPFMFSSQLITMLNVYVFAYLVREAILTGVLYIAMMIALAITAIPGSLLNAALPIGTRRNTDPFVESLRIGLALATPVIAVAIAAPTLILQTLNPELAQGANTLRILLLSITPLVTLNAVIVKLNKEKETRKLTMIGVSRLALLVLLIPPLTMLFGVEGAAASFLIANSVLLPMALKHLHNATRNIAVLWVLPAIIAILAPIASADELLMAIIAAIISFATMHLVKITTLQELHSILRIAMDTLAQRGRQGE